MSQCIVCGWLIVRVDVVVKRIVLAVTNVSTTSMSVIFRVNVESVRFTFIVLFSLINVANYVMVVGKVPGGRGRLPNGHDADARRNFQK